MIYHYPHTRRPRGRDLSKIDATKATAKYNLPVFSIVSASTTNKARNVYLSWVEDWDDESEIFLISFGEEPVPTPQPIPDEDSAAFQLKEHLKGKKHEVTTRPGQQKFKFNVFKRYGSRCAVCDIIHKELLEAAHIVPRSVHGSNDARNGLVLCYLHHRAFDVGLFTFEPNTLRIGYRNNCTSTSSTYPISRPISHA